MLFLNGAYIDKRTAINLRIVPLQKQCWMPCVDKPGGQEEAVII